MSRVEILTSDQISALTGKSGTDNLTQEEIDELFEIEREEDSLEKSILSLINPNEKLSNLKICHSAEKTEKALDHLPGLYGLISKARTITKCHKKFFVMCLEAMNVQCRRFGNNMSGLIEMVSRHFHDKLVAALVAVAVAFPGYAQEMGVSGITMDKIQKLVAYRKKQVTKSTNGRPTVVYRFMGVPMAA